MTPIPVRYCSACDRDWPSLSTYNLCPRCQRNTVADTGPIIPDHAQAAADAARYKRIREFDANADAAHDAKVAAAQQRWVDEMTAAFAATAAPSGPPAPNWLQRLGGSGGNDA